MLSMILSSTAIATAGHDVVIPITEVPDGKTTIPVAVYFADNMVYTPQWRVGNLVRIETMILNVSTCLDENDALDMDLMPLEVSKSITLQTDPETDEILIYDLLTNSSGLLDTYMVSVPSIEIVITQQLDPEDSSEPVSYTFSGGLSGEPATWDGEVTREINQYGHLIYGFLWNTEELTTLGAYEVSVKLPVEYDIRASAAHVYPEKAEDDVTQGYPDREPPEVKEDPLGFGILLEGVATGCGGIRVDAETNEAYVILGPLVAGGCSGTGGDNGDENGGGNDETGNTGNRYGTLNGRRRI
ncbi:MAG: hypothetical protein MUO87_03885 [Thermoplasmata archaeon]|nr:hypothetical protein [Thermoplasmata archaeon]